MKLFSIFFLMAAIAIALAAPIPSYDSDDCMRGGMMGQSADQLRELCQYPPAVRRCIRGGLMGVAARDLKRRCLAMHTQKVYVTYEE
ncbi:hypothetical protein Ddc_14805 [Ditylenchus destructor]|nr:hypothetical protein Ddc_14805 [Ditylenchus destructor]